MHLEATIRPERLLELGRRNDVNCRRGPSRGWSGSAASAASTGSSSCGSRRRGVLRHGRDFRADRRRLRRRAGGAGLLLRRAAVLAVRAGDARRAVGRRCSRGTATAPRRRVSGTAWSSASRRTSRATSRRRSASSSPGGRCATATAAWPASASAGASTGSRRRRSRAPSPSPARAASRPRRTPARRPARRPIRSALDDLHADRLRHGVRAVEDPALLAELAERGIVCDVTPVSNLRTGVVRSLDEHPLPAHARRRREVLHRERRPGAHADVAHARTADVAVRLGHTPRAMYEHAVAGAFCDEPTRARLKAAGDAYDWGRGCRYIERRHPRCRRRPSRLGPERAPYRHQPGPWRSRCALAASAQSWSSLAVAYALAASSPAAGAWWRSSARRSSSPAPTSSGCAAASSSRSGRRWSPRSPSSASIRAILEDYVVTVVGYLVIGVLVGLAVDRFTARSCTWRRPWRRPGWRASSSPRARDATASSSSERRPRVPARPRRRRRAHAVPRRQRRDLRPAGLHARGASRPDAARDRRGAGARASCGA